MKEYLVHSLDTVKGDIYGNCEVYSPEGELMFLCKRKKMEWYLEHNLAELIQNQTPPKIKLTFEPNGPGQVGSLFYLTPRENRCVVCAAKERLTRHHVVPKCYRKHFPLTMKQGLSHDVVVLCVECHTRVEQYYDEAKLQLSKTYNAPLAGIGDIVDHDLHYARRVYRTLTKYWQEIPLERIKILKKRIEECLGIEIKEFSLSSLDQIFEKIPTTKNPQFESHGELVVKQLDGDYDLFVYMWRLLFVYKMEPKFLSVGWSINHSCKGG